MTDAFIAPGSRSTPVALALTARESLAVHIFHDERSASFAALGHGLASGRPAVVLCSSGTAGTHFHGAVVEADLSSVPMIVVTADRPPKLWNVGAPQVIDQTHLFGDVVRSFVEPGVPSAVDALTWRPLASQVWNAAVGATGWPGPVHLNVSFDDPLVGIAGELPEGRPGGGPWHRLAPVVPQADLDGLAGRLVGREGVIVAGGGTSDPGGVVALASHLGWPILADHRSGCRRSGVSVNHFDALLRDASFASAHSPQVILRFGQILSSKALSQWIAGSGADVVVAQTGRFPSDPEHVATTILPEAGLAMALLERLPATLTPARTAEAWLAADGAADAAITQVLSESPVNDAAIARATLESVPRGGAIVMSSSMPVRDVEWFGGARTAIRAFSNRGANGIDGVVATATGIALTGPATTLLIGDVAFLHDASSLTALARRDLDLTIVVVDNDGGGIFSFLPQADALPTVRFEQLFGTPHGTDLAALAAAHGITVERWGDASEPAVDLAPRGLRIVLAQTDRKTNVDLHDRLVQAVSAAIT